MAKDTADNKKKDLLELLKEIKNTKVVANQTISTGSLFIDLQINPRRPGLRMGKCSVFAGRPGAGKSSLALSTARAFLALNKPGDPKPRKVIYIDIENGMDDSLLALYGFTRYNTENFEFKVTNEGPKILAFVERVIYAYQGCEDLILIILDGVPHMTFNSWDGNKPEFNDYSKTAAVAEGPQKLKVFFRENKARLANTNIHLMCLTFMTANIKVNKMPGDPDFIPAGGSYMQFAADVMAELKASGKAREMEVKPPGDGDGPKSQLNVIQRYQDVSWTFHKCKSAPKKELKYTLCLVNDPANGHYPGIQDLSLMLDYAASKIPGIQSGSWFNFQGCRWHGKASFKAALRESIVAAREGREPSDPAWKDMFYNLYIQVRKKILEEHNMNEEDEIDCVEVEDEE